MLCGRYPSHPSNTFTGFAKKANDWVSYIAGLWMNFAKNILESCQSKGNVDFNVSFSSEVFTFLYNAQKALMQTSGLLFT